MSTTLIYRLALGFLGLLGLALQILRDGPGMLLYYTILSNLLVTVFVFYLVYKEAKEGKLAGRQGIERAKGGVTMAILITFTIYHFMLSPLVTAEQYWNVRNFLVHYIVPLGFLADTLFWDSRKKYRWFDPLVWTLVPLAYSVFGVLNGLVLGLSVPHSPDSPFPYFFINVTKYGWVQVAQNSAGIFVSYVVGGYALLLVKRYVGPRVSRP
ncbi:Pr6Pr family membrane protein [Rothia sp. P5766]|uniref:Pr6Pr family membrane protein n=1 Tax=Rothia sp. P5766 TaxID=3402656 RepID=UPI003ADDBD9B